MRAPLHRPDWMGLPGEVVCRLALEFIFGQVFLSYLYLVWVELLAPAMAGRRHGYEHSPSSQVVKIRLFLL